MTYKKIFIYIISLLVMFILSGCNNNKIITVDEFKKEAEKLNYVTLDVTEQYTSNKNIKNVITTKGSEKYTILFFVFDDDLSATGMFNTNKSSFESYKNNNSKERSLSMIDYSIYALESDNYYMYICRVNNTLIYTKVSNIYKDKVNKLIKKLEYYYKD